MTSGTPLPPASSAPQAARATSPPAAATNGPLSCEGVASATDGFDAPELCRHYRSELTPTAARAAIACMQEKNWDFCSRSHCTLTALAAAPPAKDARCAKVERACKDMGELCDTYIAGLNEAGRARFTKCLTESCGIGVRFCLWDSSSTPCDARMP